MLYNESVSHDPYACTQNRYLIRVEEGFGIISDINAYAAAIKPLTYLCVSDERLRLFCQELFNL